MTELREYPRARHSSRTRSTSYNNASPLSKCGLFSYFQVSKTPIRTCIHTCSCSPVDRNDEPSIAWPDSTCSVTVISQTFCRYHQKRTSMDPAYPDIEKNDMQEDFVRTISRTEHKGSSHHLLVAVTPICQLRAPMMRPCNHCQSPSSIYTISMHEISAS